VSVNEPLNMPPPLAYLPSWVWDPKSAIRVRGVATADLLIFPSLIVVQPRKVGARLAKVPAVEYRWPSVIVRRIVWSHRLNFPGYAAVLLDVGGELGSASVPFGYRNKLAGMLRGAAFDVTEVVQRGWEQPKPLRASDYPHLRGTVPPCVLTSSRWA
jgi:hypothetical protein